MWRVTEGRHGPQGPGRDGIGRKREGDKWSLTHAQIWVRGGLGTQLDSSPSDRAHGECSSVAVFEKLRTSTKPSDGHSGLKTSPALTAQR